MFISRLYLKNFIGIKSGLGLDEIEINFPKNGKAVTMIRGGNGSGKSTILSMLTPFKKSFDERDKLILDGVDGIKEIDFEDNGHTYKIKHIIPGPGSKTPAASFISKDGVEQNDAGKVTLFEEYVKDEFKVGKEYFKVGKLGANIENFVNLTPGDRKLYIATFVEAVQKYLNAYKIVSDKYKLNEQQITQINNDLKKLENIDDLQKSIKENEELLVSTEATITELTKKIYKTEAEINKISKDMALINYSEAKSTLQIKTASLKKNYQINEKFNKCYEPLTIDECNNKVNEVTDKLNKLLSDKTTTDTDIQVENKKILEIDNELIKINSQLDGKSVIDLDSLQKETEEYKAKVNKYKEKLDSDELVSKLYNSDKSVNYLDSFKSFITTLLSNHDVLVKCSIEPDKTNGSLFLSPNFQEIYNAYSKSMAASIGNNRTLLEETNAEYNKKCANSDKLEILEKRPANCTNDSCPFICDALLYKNLPSELELLEEKISAVKKSIESNEIELDNLRDIKAAYLLVINAFKRLSPRENIVYQYFVNKYGKIQDLISIPYNTLNTYFAETCEKIETIISENNDYIENKSELEKRTLLWSSQIESESVRLYFENEKTQQLQLKSEAGIRKGELTTKLAELNTDIDKTRTLLTDLNDYLTSLVETDQLEKDVDDLNNTISVYENLLSEKAAATEAKNELESQLKEVQTQKDELSKKIPSLKAVEITINQLNDNLTELNKTFTNYSNVKDALSPKSGIPLIFIQSFLDSTESIANELLNIAYGGKFEIKFIPTAKDFFIQVKMEKDNQDIVIEDIKIASAGERALTTISISLALVERAIGDYNIMYLDEIDGSLDSKYRDSFIDILDKQIEKLGLEQVFVISHNKSFDTCSANLILLKGNDVDKNDSVYMSNKEIIYEATN